MQSRIVPAIEKIPNGDIVQLQGLGGYRFRVGDYRVLYDINGIILNVVDIGDRGAVYK